MDDARALAHAGAEEGTVARAASQSAGRGRAGRSWVSPPGGLWFTLILRPRSPPARWGVIPLAVGLGVARAVRARDASARVKWPNDVLTSDGKVAGVLSEARVGPDGFLLAGVGVNVNVHLPDLPEDVRSTAATLLAHGGPHDLDRVLGDALRETESLYREIERGRADAVLREYRAECVTLGRPVAIAGGTRGTATDVLDDGRLLVETADGPVTVVADDTSVVGPGPTTS